MDAFRILGDASQRPDAPLADELAGSVEPLAGLPLHPHQFGRPQFAVVHRFLYERKGGTRLWDGGTLFPGLLLAKPFFLFLFCAFASSRHSFSPFLLLLLSQCVQIAQRLEQLEVTREEYYLLKALVLINCDVRVESMAHVKTLRETVLAALSDCSAVLRYSPYPHSPAGIVPCLESLTEFIAQRRQGSGSQQQMQLLLLCMPCIRQVDSSLRRFWALVRRESRVPMNKLFLEMLESPMR